LRYAGWYPRRRGLLEHLEHGTISLLDAAVHDFLCLTADHQTGVTWVSAEKIHVLAGADISLRAVQRSLARLEKLSWIKRFMRPGKKGNYPTLIGRYFVRDSSLKWLSVNLERTSDWRDVQFDAVTDPSFVANGGGNRAVTQSDTDASPHQEVRLETEEERGVEIDSKNESEYESAASLFEGFDLPKDRKLRISNNLAKSLHIDLARLSPEECKIIEKLDPIWAKSWKSVARGEIKLDEWMIEALQSLKRSGIWYPMVLSRRMYELMDGRLAPATP
jgi:hypothetical protein